MRDCRNCSKWEDCPCGKQGHDNGSSIGYSPGECIDYEVRMDEKLKPCPFFGEEAKIFQVGIDANPDSVLNGTFIIGCDGIHGSLCPGYIYKCSPVYTSKELAVKMWNDRDN